MYMCMSFIQVEALLGPLIHRSFSSSVLFIAFWVSGLQAAFLIIPMPTPKRLKALTGCLEPKFHIHVKWISVIRCVNVFILRDLFKRPGGGGRG